MTKAPKGAVRKIVGGVISPLLANIYLHEVLDVWFKQEVQPRLKGRAFLVRYADDFVMGFACEGDARRVLEVLSKRFGKYGLTLHPDKTRLVRFYRPAASRPKATAGGSGTLESFDFLGFTHFWSRSKKGNWVVKRQTARSRFRRALGKIADWCRRNLHRPIMEQCQALWRKLEGHYRYVGLIGNGRLLWCFRDRVQEIWQKWLSRRGGPRKVSWAGMHPWLQGLPRPQGWVAPRVANR